MVPPTHCRKCGNPLFAAGVKPLNRAKVRCPCGWVQMVRPSRFEEFSELVEAARAAKEAKRKLDAAQK